MRVTCIGDWHYNRDRQRRGYRGARDAEGVYAIEIAPDGEAPKCPALEAKGLKLVKSFERVKDFPAVHLFE